MRYKAKFYDDKTLTEKVWHNSSMIKYTEMVENPEENVGDLTVVFNNGSTYRYKDVTFADYVLLVSGGIDASNGKTFNKVIKAHGYAYEKLSEPLTQEYIDRGYQELVDKENERVVTYFISGHRDITEEEFEMNYMPAIDAVIDEVPNCRFVVGDYNGADIMAQNYLLDVCGIEPERVTVYHMGDTAMNLNPKVCNIMCGFASDSDRDAAMTAASSEDIAFVRDNTKMSGTAENILRRHLLY